MDIRPNLPDTPLRKRVETLEEFQRLPLHVFPLTATQGEDGVISIGGVSLLEIAREVGTAAFIIDEEDFRTRCRSMADSFGGAHRVHYASKAFLTREICHWVEEEGLCMDVASLGELEVALRAHFPPNRITVHGNNKPMSFLRRAIEAGVEFIVVDSLSEIERINDIAQELNIVQDVLVRVKPGVHVDTHEFISTAHEDQKFGFSLASGSAYAAAQKVMEAPGLLLRGLHCHVGSQVFEADGFILAAQRVLKLWATLYAEHSNRENFNILDLGGGYGIAYTSDQTPLNVSHVAQKLLEQVEYNAQLLNVPTPIVMVEPGRAIAGPSTVTMYTVGAIKDVHTSSESTRRYISVDGGMSDNIRPALYQAEYDIRLVNRHAQGTMIPSRVVGAHCESGDILINDALLPDDISPEDFLVIPATGAYCYSMSSRYNMIFRPPVVVVKDGEWRLMLRRETIDDFFALEPLN